MKYYSLPSDFRKETIDEYEKLNNSGLDSRIIETYGNITIGDLFGSGRLVRQMSKVDIHDLYEYVKYSKERNIEFDYTFNAPHLQNMEFTTEGISKLKDFLGKIYDAGIRSLTVTLPSLMELIQSTKYDFKIKASCLCQVRNANRALAYKKLGVEKIVTDESINKDFYTLKSIREAFGDKIEIIVNQICDKNCMYRMFHYNMISGDSVGSTNKASINYYEHRCVLQQLRSIDNLLKLCWVRPEDIKYYTEIGIHYFKLQGRHTFVQGGDAVRTVKAYFEENFDGNLIDLLTMFAKLTSFSVYVDNKKLDGFIKPFFEIENFCKNNCSQCRYCESFAKKCIDYDQAKEVVELAKKFYNDYDQYKKLLNTEKPGNEAIEQDECKPAKELLLLKDMKQDRGDFDF
jgi:collagenase-like PrtC family protease